MKILKFFLFFFVGFMSCSERNEYDIYEHNVSNSEDSEEFNHYLISRKNAVIKVQKVLDILYNKDITRCDAKSKTVNEKGIMDGFIHSTRGEQASDCVFYVIPFEQNGYSIVDANDCEIISIIPNGCITRSEIDEQIELVQKQIKFEDNLLKLEDYILTEQKYTESNQILAPDSITYLGDVIYSDLWNRDEGYTVWFDQVDDVDIYT